MYGRVDIAAVRTKPGWQSNADVLAAYEVAHNPPGGSKGTGNTARNVLTALTELARTIEPQLLTDATPKGLLEYARARRRKCRHLQGDGRGSWVCKKSGGIAYGVDVQACPLFAEPGEAKDCPQYQPLVSNSQLQHLYSLSSAFDWMRSQGAIQTNPAVDARREFLLETKNERLLEDQDKLARLITDEELARLLAACPPELRRLISIMAKAGLRIGEALSLRVQDVDLEEGTLCIPTPNLYCNKRRGLRVIRMDAELTNLLQTQLRYRQHLDGVDALFTNRNGRAFSPDNGSQDLNKAVQNAAIRAGIQLTDAGKAERITTHCMRRWFSNQLSINDVGGVALGTQLILRGDKLPGALSRYLDQPALAEPLWREHMPRLPQRSAGTAVGLSFLF